MGGFAFDIERKNTTKQDIPLFKTGDTVDVHVRIKEGNKERIQVFSGAVISRKHQGLRETFTVRRMVSGEGVERVFPLHSPQIEKIEVTRRGAVRRAKLYYLRDRVGKAGRIAEDLKRGRENIIDEKRIALPEEQKAPEPETSEPEASASEEVKAETAAPESSDQGQKPEQQPEAAAQEAQ